MSCWLVQERQRQRQRLRPVSLGVLINDLAGHEMRSSTAYQHLRSLRRELATLDERARELNIETREIHMHSSREEHMRN